MVIYKTTNTINNKWYIGKDERNNPNYLGSGKLLRQAIAKYGKEAFKKEILVEASTKEELAELEKKIIKEYNAVEDKMAYNIAIGGQGGNLIAGFSEEEKKARSIKISLGLKNMSKEAKEKKIKKTAATIAERPFQHPPRSAECRRKISEAQLGSKRSEEVKQQMSVSRKGKKRSQAFCETQSRMRKGKPQPKLQKTYKLTSICNDIEIITSNLKETCKELNLSYQGMFDQARISRAHKGWVMEKIS
jgi:hypothetical protein